MQARCIAIVLQIAQERNGLQCFAQSHFIRKNAIDPVVIQGYEPVEALNLVVFHRAAFDIPRALAKHEDIVFVVIVLILHELLIFFFFSLPMMPLFASRVALAFPLALASFVLSSLLCRLVQQTRKLWVAVFLHINKVLEQFCLSQQVAEAFQAVDALLPVHLGATSIKTLVLCHTPLCTLLAGVHVARNFSLCNVMAEVAVVSHHAVFCSTSLYAG